MVLKKSENPKPSSAAKIRRRKARQAKALEENKILGKGANSKQPNAQQWVFIHEYMKDFNGARSAREAGYLKGNAGVTACKLLQTPKIAREIAALVQTHLDAADVSTERIISEFKKVAFVNLMDFVNVNNGGKVTLNLEMLKDMGDSGAAVKSIKQSTDGEVTVVFHDKLKALESLGKYKKLFIERLELTGEVQVGSRLGKARARRAQAQKENRDGKK